MSTTDTIEKAHPFELAGMGRGPFRFVGTYEMPDLSENSASNFANSNPYAGAPKLIGGLGTCANCGMAISNICVVENADGELYGVGCDCVEKTGDKSLGDAAKIAIAKIRQRKNRERADRQRAQRQLEWENAVSTVAGSRDGETNGQRVARQDEERKMQERAAADKRAKVAAILEPIAEVIRDGKGGFCDSIASDMKNGHIPHGRGLDLAIEIYAKNFGRRNSNAFEAANLEACNVFAKAQEVA